MRITLQAVALIALVFGLTASDDAETYAWLTYGSDGRPHLRVVPPDRAQCPHATADGAGVALGVVVIAEPGFDRVLCDAALPDRARTVTVDDRTLPVLPQRITRIAVLGDTGCRIKGSDIQDCRDAQAWPFARIAAAIARESPRPDLIVHVGDYQYRESACPAGDPRCADSPFGDNWTTWAVDFFEPALPLFATAPVVWVRGNHEDCARSGLGWTRYLSPDPSTDCRTHEPPAVISFDDMRIVDVDSAAGNEDNPDPAAFERDERIAEAAVAGRETFLVTHRPPLAYLAAHAAADPNGPDLAAIIAGHVHLFATLPFAGAPPTVILGNGGDELATAAVAGLQSAFRATTVEARFGYAIFDRIPGGWSISERDPDGTEHRRCELRARTVHC